MTDTPEIARIREALAAGPTPGDWIENESVEHWGRVNVTIVSPSGIDVAQVWQGNSNVNRLTGCYIAACNPVAMASVLAHIDAQTKRTVALELLVKSIEGQRSMMRVEIDASKEARATLQSERDANALLTAQVEAQAAEIEMLRAIIADCRDAAPTPAPWSEADSEWQAAMSVVEGVPGFLKASFSAHELEIERLSKDAGRYQWLRMQRIDGEPGVPVVAMPNGMRSGYYLNEETADFAIDTAMKEQE